MQSICQGPQYEQMSPLAKMETKLPRSRFLSCVLVLPLVLSHVVVGPAVGQDEQNTFNTTTQPFLPPSYIIEADMDIVTPTCIMLTWELRPLTNMINGSRISTVKLWRIVLSTLPRRTERETVDELILPGSRSNITLGPFELGSAVLAEVYLQKFVTMDGQTREGGSSYPTTRLRSKELPRSDRSCSKSNGYRRNPCSECVCISSSFTGPTCEDPTFRPQNVSAWPLSDGSMHIQWTFNASKHLKSLKRANLRLSNITLNITEASTGSLVMTDYVPINYQSEAYGYDVRQSLSPGVEYDVVVGVGAANRYNSNMVVANSSVRTFIPEGIVETGDVDGEALMLSGEAVPGVIVGVAVASGLLASLVSVVTTAVCMRARAKQTCPRPARPSRPPAVPIRALNPNSNLPLSPISRLPPRMEQNPAYGQLSLSIDSNSTNYPGQSGGLAGVEYENTAGTIGSYAYITPT